MPYIHRAGNVITSHCLPSKVKYASRPLLSSSQPFVSLSFQANPAVKIAVKSVKDGGRGLQHKSKSAYRGMKSKMKTSASQLEGGAAAMGAGTGGRSRLGENEEGNMTEVYKVNRSQSGHTKNSSPSLYFADKM